MTLQSSPTPLSDAELRFLRLEGHWPAVEKRGALVFETSKGTQVRTRRMREMFAAGLVTLEMTASSLFKATPTPKGRDLYRESMQLNETPSEPGEELKSTGLLNVPSRQGPIERSRGFGHRRSRLERSRDPSFAATPWDPDYF